MCSLFAACSSDDDEDEPKGVVIDEDGNASGGMQFTAIDDNTFSLDFIIYHIVDDHLVVTGYNKEKLEGKADIVGEITYKGKTYQVQEIGINALRGL